jgi:ferric-dicitrate binding protein FerR (iron transport regulator)
MLCVEAGEVWQALRRGSKGRNQVLNQESKERSGARRRGRRGAAGIALLVLVAASLLSFRYVFTVTK